MKQKYFLLTLLITSFSIAQVTQGFEGVAGIDFTGTNTCYYFDNDFITTHNLVNYTNGCGTVIVTTPNSGSFAGYNVEFTPDGGTGFSDFDAFGVATTAGLASQITTTPSEGNQVFFMEDTDGVILMDFGIVNLSGTTSPSISLDYYLEETSWEAADLLNIYVAITDCGTNTVSLIDTTGQDIDNLGIEGAWRTLNADLTAHIGCKAQLFIQFSSNSASEELAIDNIVFSEGNLDSTLSTTNFENDLLINLSPNPVKSNRTLNISNNSQNTITSIEVFDVIGKKVYSTAIVTNSIQFSNTIPNGMYFVKITDNKNNSITKKVILE